MGKKHIYPVQRFVLVCSLCGFAFLSFLNMRNYARYPMLLGFIGFVFIFAVGYITLQATKKTGRFFILFLFLVSIATKIVLVLNIHTSPSSDFKLFYDSAVNLAHGDASFSQSAYFQNWAYQTGIVLYYAMLIKLFGTGIIPLVLINCIWIAGVNVFVYLIARMIVHETTARFISILYLLYPANYYLVSVLTNQHLSNFFMISGIYLFLAATCVKHKFPLLHLLLSGVLIALGNVIRPQGIIVIAAIIVLCIATLVDRYHDLIDLQQIVKCAFLIILIYFTVNFTLSKMVELSGINNNGLANKYPLWKFVVGLNSDTTGSYSNRDVKEIYSIRNSAERNNVSMKVIQERLSDPYELGKLLFHKSDNMWAKYDTLQWGFSHLFNNQYSFCGINITFNVVSELILVTERTFTLFIFLSIGLGIIRNLRDIKSTKAAYIFLIMIIMAYVLLHLFIEVQPRYRDYAMMFAFIVGSAGLDYWSTLKGKNLMYIEDSPAKQREKYRGKKSS